MRAPSLLLALAWLGTLVFWILGVGIPLAALAARVSGADWSAFWDPDIRQVAWVTARQAGLSTLFSVAIGLPFGLWAARASPRVARWIDSVLLLPQGVPTVVAATAWVAWLGRSGWIARLDLAYSLSAVIIAHVFFNAPWVALLVAQSRRSVPQSMVDAAATLGAGAWSRFRFVAWPQVRWALGAAAAQTLAVCSMSFALVMILGGGPPVETLETALYARLRGGALDLTGAVMCAVWEVLLTLTPWLLLLWLRSRVAQRSETSLDESRASSRWSGLAVVAAALFVLPYFATLDGETFKAWASAGFWLDARSPLRLSALIAAWVSFVTLATAVCALLAVTHAPRGIRAVLEIALSLPGGLSVLVLGLGAWLAYSRWIDPFDGSLLAIVLLQCAIFFPAAYRMLWPMAQTAQKREMEAAWTLGAGPVRAFWLVEWPRWRGPVLSVVALTAALAMGEVAAVSLFYSENLIPLPLLVSRWMGQYRFEEARAAAALLLVLSSATMLGVGRYRATSRV